MRLSVMVSSTIYTNHSSSFSTAKIIWRNRICIGCSFHGWLFKDWPFDYHDYGTFRTSLGEASHKLESKQWLIQIGSHPDVDALDVPQVDKQDGYDLVLWQQISTFHQHFLPFFSDGQLLSLDDAWLLFSAIGCFWTSLYFPPKSHLIVIFFLFSNCSLPLHSFSVLHDYCSIEAALCSIKFCWRRWC